jgi:hypothetical protein
MGEAARAEVAPTEAFAGFGLAPASRGGLTTGAREPLVRPVGRVSGVPA